MTAKKNVALFIETSSNFGRDLLSGIARYLKSDSSWSIFLEERDLASKPPQWFTNWKGQGILTRAMNAEFNRFRACRCRCRCFTAIEMDDLLSAG